MATKWTEPRMWKRLERHPLSKDYEDIDRTQMLADLKEFGNVDGRKIEVALDAEDDKWKVLDGWQFYQCHVDANIKPAFKPVGGDLETRVRIKNDNRRHETPESIARHVAARQERVVAKREAGESLRAIAEQEGVAVVTVQSDLETVSTVRGSTVTPSGGVVTGLDGRKQPANRETPGLIEDLAKLKLSPKIIPEIEKLPRADQNKMAGLIGSGMSVRKALDEVSRQPGDDTPKRGKPSTNGKPLFDWKAFDSHFGYVARVPNELVRIFGKDEKSSDEYKACMGALETLATTAKNWKKRLQKAH